MHVTFQADDVAVRHTLLKEVGKQWGAATRLVLQEFVANVAEHCSNRRVDLDVFPHGLVAMDYGGGFQCSRSQKPKGEGGYGLHLIRRFGGAVSSWERGMKLEVRFPEDADGVTARRSRKSTLTRLASLSQR